MTDIVERLRDVAGFIEAEHGRVASAACLATEAAYEIERLRAALSQAANDLEDWGAYVKANNARAALEGK